MFPGSEFAACACACDDGGVLLWWLLFRGGARYLLACPRALDLPLLRRVVSCRVVSSCLVSCRVASSRRPFDDLRLPPPPDPGSLCIS